MTVYEDNPHTQFGIDEVYIHDGFEETMLDKLKLRAALTLDCDDTVVQKNLSHDMILVFHKRLPSKSLIYRFLEFLHHYDDRDNYIRFNTLLNEEELLEAIQSKKFILATQRTLSKEIYQPS